MIFKPAVIDLHSRVTLGLLGLAVLIFSLGLFGCSKAPVETSDPKIELEFWTLQMLTFSDYMTAMIAEYEKQHPNIKIKWVDVPFSEGEKKALTSMMAKHTPDIINLNPDFSAILANRGALLDMNEWVSEEQKASYIPVAWQGASLGKKTFGLPWYLSSAVTLYNQSLLRKAGFQSPPGTYEDMAHMAPLLRQKAASYILMPTITDGGRFFRVLQKDGIRIWNDRQELVFADNGAGKALAFWVNLYKKNWVPQESITEGQQAAVDRYQSGTLALLLTGPNFLKIVQENAPKVFETTQVAPQFPAKSSYMDFSEMILVIPARTPHPKEAVEFARFVSNAQNTLKLSELAPIIPPHVSAVQSPAFNQTHSPDLMTRARSISAQQLLQAKTAMTIHPLQNRLNQLMDFYVQSAFLGKLSPEDAMQKAQQDMNNLIQ